VLKPPDVLSYHRAVKRLDLYFKVEVDLSEGEDPKKLSEEIIRVLKKVYGVRRADLDSMQER
jgi:hypothetical protein